ncbi:MAG: hypothetical protein HFJ09_06505 [Lachnospiraceae bacterium]|nr:hypothetical protein [Lachnospiraceae bacterium]
MNKEEILAKSRKENERCDEFQIQIRDKSMKWTYITLVVVAAIFAWIRAEQGLPMMDLCVTICSSVCVGQFYRFIKTKDKWCLIMAVITLLVGIFAVIRFLGGH